MPRATSGDARLANRLRILQIRADEPSLGVVAIARQVGVSESTVRSVLKRFQSADASVGAPPAKKGAGRKSKQTKRWQRCVWLQNLCEFSNVFDRHLRVLATRNPEKSCAQLAHEMYEWQVQTIRSLPPGAVCRAPLKLKKHAIARYLINLCAKMALTVPRCLKRMGLNSYKATKVQYISPANKAARLAFVRRHENSDFTSV